MILKEKIKVLFQLMFHTTRTRCCLPFLRVGFQKIRSEDHCFRCLMYNMWAHELFYFAMLNCNLLVVWLCVQTKNSVCVSPLPLLGAHIPLYFTINLRTHTYILFWKILSISWEKLSIIMANEPSNWIYINCSYYNDYLIFTLGKNPCRT